VRAADLQRPPPLSEPPCQLTRYACHGTRLGSFTLAADELRFYNAHGFLYLPAVVDGAACDILRQEVLEKWSPFYDVPLSHCYTDYKEMLEKEQPDIVSVCTQVRCHRPPIEPLTDPNVPLTNRPLLDPN
jgi:hypothetical protein